MTSHVVADGVWQDDHTALALLQLLGHLHGGRHRGPRAPACNTTREDKTPTPTPTACQTRVDKTPTPTPTACQTRVDETKAPTAQAGGALTTQEPLLPDEQTRHVEGVFVNGLYPGVYHLIHTTATQNTGCHHRLRQCKMTSPQITDCVDADYRTWPPQIPSI